MNYEIVESESFGVITRHVIIDRGDGSFESFPVDEDNPRYQEWVAEGGEPEVIDG